MFEPLRKSCYQPDEGGLRSLKRRSANVGVEKKVQLCLEFGSEQIFKDVALRRYPVMYTRGLEVKLTLGNL